MKVEGESSSKKLGKLMIKRHHVIDIASKYLEPAEFIYIFSEQTMKFEFLYLGLAHMIGLYFGK